MTRRRPNPLPVLRRHALRDALTATVVLLGQQRADDVADGFLDDYLALRWLEWDAGALRLTVTGRDICRHVAAVAA